MKKAWRPVLLSTTLALLSACAQNVVTPAFFDGCLADARKRVEEANWEKARTITIRIRQNEFEPMVFRLVQDRPYVLVINNNDESLHFFLAQKFFRSIALAEVTSGEQMFVGGCAAVVAVEPQKNVELRFVAVRNGRYDFEDSPHLLSFIRLGSASGSISIEPEKNYFTKPVTLRAPKPTTTTPVAPVRTTPLGPVKEPPAKPDESLFDTPIKPPAAPKPPTATPVAPVRTTPLGPVKEPPAKPDESLFGAPLPEEPPAKPDESLFDTLIKPPAAPEDRAPGKPGEGLFDTPIGKPPAAPG
ncbi:MAG: hypothetical protein V3V55_00370 [Rhodospirillales bacterium]